MVDGVPLEAVRGRDGPCGLRRSRPGGETSHATGCADCSGSPSSWRLLVVGWRFAADNSEAGDRPLPGRPVSRASPSGSRCSCAFGRGASSRGWWRVLGLARLRPGGAPLPQDRPGSRGRGAPASQPSARPRTAGVERSPAGRRSRCPGARSERGASADGLADAGVRGGTRARRGTSTLRSGRAAGRARPRPGRAPRSCSRRRVRIDSRRSSPSWRSARLFPHARRDRSRDPDPPEPAAALGSRRRSSGSRRWPGLAADFRQGGFLRRAIASYEEVLRARSEAPRGAAGAGRACWPRSATSRAPSRWRGGWRGSRAGRRARSRPRCCVEMAEAARAEGRNDDARKAVKRALRKNRQLVRAWVVLGRARGGARPRQGGAGGLGARSRDSIAAAGRASIRSSRRPSRRWGARATSRRCCASCSRSAPTTPARAWRWRGRWPRGATWTTRVAELRAVLEREPDDLEARGALGRILLAEGRDAGGRPGLRRAARRARAARPAAAPEELE